MLQEFYKPMKNNGLLTCEQLDVIFQNLEELIEVNKQFTDRLQQTVEAAIVAGDEVKGFGLIFWLIIKTILRNIYRPICILMQRFTIKHHIYRYL